MMNIGEALVQQLQDRDVSVVFGIPGVHTVELYRGLSASTIRHVTPRHEQGAGFMADGYARVSGKPGVAFVITGPGLTNTLTPMAQARADSVPMLVISGVNDRPDLGRGLGHLHELPNQLALTQNLALYARQITSGEDLVPALAHAFNLFENCRGGPVHIEIPIDVMPMSHSETGGQPETDVTAAKTPQADVDVIKAAADRLNAGRKPIILAGGGARWCDVEITKLAERLDAPVVLTANARGLLHAHPLCVPASPSLGAVRQMIREADVILALGSELGPTDYDVYSDGQLPDLNNLIRVDISSDQLARHSSSLLIHDRVEIVVPALLSRLGQSSTAGDGAERARLTRQACLAEIGPDMRAQLALLDTLRDTLPNAIMVGDSTQPIYAGNLYYDHDRPGGWFNAATGFGALGYAIPASIGASLAAPTETIVCITGDGGAQFTLPELMTAVDEKLPILFLVWNNRGYQEIETSMMAAGVDVVGCDPTPPDFSLIAAACGIPFSRCEMSAQALREAIERSGSLTGPVMVEIEMPKSSSTKAGGK